MGAIDIAWYLKFALLAGPAQLARIERAHERHCASSASVLYSTVIYEKANHGV